MVSVSHHTTISVVDSLAEGHDEEVFLLFNQGTVCHFLSFKFQVMAELRVPTILSNQVFDISFGPSELSGPSLG